MYHLLLDNRKDLLAVDGPLASFSLDETRVLLRPTRTYDQLLFESFHPDVLHDALHRDLLFDRLWMVVPDRPFMADAIGAEQLDLRQGDIPVFTTQPTSLTLWSATGESIDGILLEDGMSIARRRINMLSSRDLHRQEWFIRSTLATLITFEYGISPPVSSNYQLISISSNCNQTRLLSSARTVAQELIDTAIHGEDDVTWIGLEHFGEGTWDLAPVGVDLYGGLAGISLFLAFAGKILQDDAITSLARKSATGIVRHSQRFSSELPEIGAFVGWGGILLTLTQLARLWNDDELLTQAENLVKVIADLIAEDENYAIYDGAAGAIAPLLGFYQVTSSNSALDTAVACGDHLLASAQKMETGLGWAVPRHGPRPLLGFAHGTAGIASALLKLAQIAGHQRFVDAAHQAMAYERRLFSSQAQNWPDLRHIDPEEEPEKYPIAWCHGAAGVGLARLQSLALLDDQRLSAEIQSALYTATNHGFGQNHSLCHGDMGLLELLLVAHQTTGNKQITNLLNQRVASILESIDRDGWQCGGPMAVEMPGLMIGIAGIGYQLLRLADPRHIPSILLLDPPPA
jgi:type 2 lantibiotic biosynthesis protein LanM